VTTGSSVFSTLLFHQLIPPREILRSNLAPDRQYQRTTTTYEIWYMKYGTRVDLRPTTPCQISPPSAQNLKIDLWVT